jgi:predicted enzyme related to lactoylglutathione lyase
MSTAEIRGKFVWHELLTNDTAAATTFYPKVLPWRMQASSMPGYNIWMAGQTQVGGLMAIEDGGTPPHWLVYVGTPSVDATCTQAQGLGAKVHKAPTDIPNVGRFAVLTDPQGATFAVFTPAAGAPAPQPPQVGGFTWHELATTDVAAALRFYGELFGWRKGPGHDMGGAMGTYQLIEHGTGQVGGMYNVQSVQGSATPPSWLSYTHVADVNRAVAAAKSAGGRLLHGPMEVPGGSWIALLLDPQGGAFAAQEMPRTTAAAPKPPAAAKPAPKPAAAKAAVAKPAAAKPAAAKPAAAKPAAAKPAAKSAAPKKKAAKKKAAKKKVAKKKTARKARPAKKSARKTARRAAPKKKQSARRARRRR